MVTKREAELVAIEDLIAGMGWILNGIRRIGWIELDMLGWTMELIELGIVFQLKRNIEAALLRIDLSLRQVSKDRLSCISRLFDCNKGTCQTI